MGHKTTSDADPCLDGEDIEVSPGLDEEVIECVVFFTNRDALAVKLGKMEGNGHVKFGHRVDGGRGWGPTNGRPGRVVDCCAAIKDGSFRRGWSVIHQRSGGIWGGQEGRTTAVEGGIILSCLVCRCTVVYRRGVVQFGLLGAMDFRVRFLQVPLTGGSVVIVVPVWGPVWQVDLS